LRNLRLRFNQHLGDCRESENSKACQKIPLLKTKCLASPEACPFRSSEASNNLYEKPND
jgi:hypothetical protein